MTAFRLPTALAFVSALLAGGAHAANPPAHAASAAPAASSPAPAASSPAAPAASASAPAAPAAAPSSSAAVASAASPKNSGDGVAVVPAPADSSKRGTSCEEVKASIEAKLKAKGVKAFTLDVVGKDETKDAKVVGSCEGGKKKITYKRG